MAITPLQKRDDCRMNDETPIHPYPKPSVSGYGLLGTRLNIYMATIYFFQKNKQNLYKMMI
jgi:hypothetical protein